MNVSPLPVCTTCPWLAEALGKAPEKSTTAKKVDANCTHIHAIQDFFFLAFQIIFLSVSNGYDHNKFLPWNMAAFWIMRRLSCALTTCRPDSMLLRAATWYRSSIFLEQQDGPLVWQTCRSAPGRKSAETGWKSGWAEGRSWKAAVV